jgi:DNA polymerase elongation subunit (family B)
MSNKFYTNVQLYGNNILLRGYENGEKFHTREQYSPTLYVSSKKPSEWKTLTGESVQPVKPGSIRDCRDFIKKYKDVENFNVFGNERFAFQYIADNYPGEIQYDPQLINILSLDIEVESEYGFPDPESADEEVLLITIQDYVTKQIITWGQIKHGEFDNKQENVDFRPCESEYHLLSAFIQWWQQNPPDVITGWNIDYYDIPYLVRRMKRVLGDKLASTISPWKFVTDEEHFFKGMKKLYYNIAGVTQLDYLVLYTKFTYTNQESYRLDHIANVELGQKKLDHSEFETFKDFYRKGWQKFVEYNIVDVELVDRLEEKLKLIDLAITMAFDAKVNFQDVFSQVRLWDTIIYNYLRDRNIVIPQKEQTSKSEKFAGAYVKEPKPGLYEWVVSFDLNSLYPHLLMQYNISPETLMEERCPNISIEKVLNEEVTFEMYKDYAVCPNGAMYRKDFRGFLPTLMEKMYDERKAFKKKMLKSKQILVDIEAEMKKRGVL